MSLQNNQVEASIKEPSCLICKHSHTNENPLYTCSMCGLCVHQWCYGITDISSPWICRYCQSEKTVKCCALCEREDTRGLIPISKRCWAHVLCLIFCEDCGFEVNPSFEIVNGLPEFSKTKGKVNPTNLRDIQQLHSEKHRSYKNILYSYYGEECTLYTHIPSSRGVIQHHNRLRVPCAICKGKINSSFVRCFSDECLMYFHPGCVIDQYYSSSPIITLQFAPRLTGRGYSILVSCPNHITPAVSHLPWDRSLPPISSIPQIVSYGKVHPCHLCQDVISFVKARKEQVIRKGILPIDMIKFIKSKELSEGDPVIELTNPFQYMVSSYMHYVMNADIHIYEQQAYRFSKGELSDYMELVKDTVNRITNEEIGEIKIPQMENGDGMVRHSSRFSPGKHQTINYSLLRAPSTRLTDGHQHRKLAFTLPQATPRKRVHSEISHSQVPSVSSTQPFSSERFWKLIDTIYYHPLPKAADFVPQPLSMQPVSSSGPLDNREHTFYSWSNPSVSTDPLDPHSREVRVLIESIVAAEIVYVVSNKPSVPEKELRSLVTEAWTSTIMKATALQSVGGKILTRTITVTPPQVPAGMVLKSFRIIPLRSIHIDRRFDPINLDIVNLMNFDRAYIEKMKKIYDNLEKNQLYPEEKFLENSKQLMVTFHNYDCFCQIKNNLEEVFNKEKDNLKNQLRDTLVSLRNTRKRRLPLFPMDPDYCTVCNNYSLDRDDENFIIGNNPIIYCNSCNIGVHLKCIGLTEVPDVFTCDKCLFLRKGGDPSKLVCAYCPSRYGYLFSCKRTGDDQSQGIQFCHLPCALFSDGGRFLNFCRVSISNSLVRSTYVGPSITSNSHFDHHSITLVQPEYTASNQHTRSTQRSIRNATPQIFPYTPPSLLFDCSMVNVQSLSSNCTTAFSSFRDNSLVETENLYKSSHRVDSSYRCIFPTLVDDTPIPVSTNHSGDLCMICRLPMGVTIRCSQPNCPCSFHLSCLWAVGGEITFHDKNRFYVDHGISPSVEAYCLSHQKNVSKELIQMRIIQRNKYRIPNITSTLSSLMQNESQIEESMDDALSLEPSSEQPSEPTQSTQPEPTTPVTTTPSVCECCVCGYGAVAPPLSFCLLDCPNDVYPIREQPRRRGRPPLAVSQLRSVQRASTILDEWNFIINDILNNERARRENEQHQQSFCEGNRGCFWKCVGCGCTIHEKCLDFVDQWMLFKDDHFKYYLCLKCLLADPITDFSGVHHFAPFYEDGVLMSNVRPTMSQHCCICNRDTGYLTYTSAGTFIHKQCGFCLPHSSYNLVSSYYDHITPISTEHQQRPSLEHDSCEMCMRVSNHTRTHVEFLIPDQPLMASSSSICLICRSRKGCLVRCGYENCTHCFHVSCLRHNLCVYFPTPQGLYLRCMDHIPPSFQYDSYLNAIVPKYYLSVETMIKDRISPLRKLKDSWTKFQSRFYATQVDNILHMKKNYNDVVSYYRRKIHFCSISKGHIFIMEKSMMASWSCQLEGIQHLQPVLSSLHSRLIEDHVTKVVTIETAESEEAIESEEEVIVSTPEPAVPAASEDNTVEVKETTKPEVSEESSDEYIPPSVIKQDEVKKEREEEWIEREKRKKELFEERKKKEEERKQKRREADRLRREKKKLEEEKKEEEKKKKEEEEKRMKEEEEKRMKEEEEKKKRREEEKRMKEEEKKKREKQQEEKRKREEEKRKKKNETDRLRREKKRKEREEKKEEERKVMLVEWRNQLSSPLSREIESFLLPLSSSSQSTSSSVKSIPSTKYDGLSDRSSWDTYIRRASNNRNRFVFGKLTKALMFKTNNSFDQYSRLFISKTSMSPTLLNQVLLYNSDQFLGQCVVYELEHHFNNQEEVNKLKNQLTTTSIKTILRKMIKTEIGQEVSRLLKEIIVEKSQSVEKLISMRILANTRKKAENEHTKCIVCSLSSHSPAIHTLPHTSFVCNYCLDNRGSYIIGLFVQVYYKDEWFLCRIIGWNKEKHIHYLLSMSNQLLAICIGDYFHFYRTDTDILYENCVGIVNYYSILKNNTLLLQNAFEEEEDAPDELAPKGYYDNSKHVCKKCRRSTNDASLLLCDNCNDAYHMKCVQLRKIPDQHWYCENCLELASKFTDYQDSVL